MRHRRMGLILVVLVVFGSACGGDEDGGGADSGIALNEPIGASTQTVPGSTSASEARNAVAKSAFAAMEVPRRDLDSAAQAVVDTATARDIGGFLVSSVYDTDEGYGAARVVVNVPSPAFETVVGKLGTIGEVTRQELAGEDITPEVVTAQESLRRARDRTAHLLRLLSRADDEATRFKLRGLIHSSKAKIRSADQNLSRVGADVALATVDVALSATPPPAPPNKPVIERALGTATAITLGIASGAVLVAGVVLPIAGVMLAVLGLGAPLVRRLKPRFAKWPA